MNPSMAEAGPGDPELTLRRSSAEYSAESSAEDTRALLVHQVLPNGSPRGEQSKVASLVLWLGYKITVQYLY